MVVLYKYMFLIVGSKWNAMMTMLPAVIALSIRIMKATSNVVDPVAILAFWTNRHRHTNCPILTETALK